MNTDNHREVHGSTAGQDPAMETHAEKQRPANSQLIFVPHKDTVRLLEVYVKRSLSLNESSLGFKRSEKKEKWVTVPKRHRRHSSDPSLHLHEASNDEESGVFSASDAPEDRPEPCPEEEEKPTASDKKPEVFPTPRANVVPPEPCPEEAEKPTRKSKKLKKPSFWKNIFGFFSRKTSEDKDEEQDSSAEASDDSDVATNCLPTAQVTAQRSARRKSLKRRFSKKRLSLIKPNEPAKDLNAADITGVQEVVSVEPTYAYYENVSAELEKIVHEVKVKEEDAPLSNKELIDRIIALTKEQGDAIDDKLRDNPTLNSFFQKMTYSSFQKLADAYLETEASPTLAPPTASPTAPELVKLAFTLDFTARIAGLSKQSVGYITGLGNRYLQDRFEYTQACTDHPWSDSED